MIRQLSSGMCFLLLVPVFATRSAMAETCIQPDQLHVETIDRPFVQDRFLAGMEKPLKSEGRLKVAADTIRWHMTAPFDVETVLTPTTITQSINGGPPQQAGPNGADLSASIARMLANLLQGRWSDLQSVFRVSKGTGAVGAPWSVSLEPLDPQMNQILGKIEVQGCTDIATIRIAHPNGDREVIDFAPASTPAP